MIRFILFLTLACASAVALTSAMAGSHRYYSLPGLFHNPYNPCSNPSAVLAQGPYVGYNPCKDSNAVFVAGTYAGSDPDPNIRAALRREFARR
jgi:hypothetical protein